MSKSPKEARPNFYKPSGSVFRNFKKAKLIYHEHGDSGDLWEERWEILGWGRGDPDMLVMFYLLTWAMLTWVSAHCDNTFYLYQLICSLFCMV